MESYVSFSDCCCSEDTKTGRYLKMIDNDCADCLYEAGKIAVEDILMSVINNELTPREQRVLKLKWFENRKTDYICTALGVIPKTVRSDLKKAENKIYNSLKYVVLYDNLIDGRQKLPTDFHFKIINCINGKELIS